MSSFQSDPSISHPVTSSSLVTVAFSPNLERTIGEAAKTQETSYFPNIIGWLKRLIGRSEASDPELAERSGKYESILMLPP